LAAALTAGSALALPGVAAGQPSNASTSGHVTGATPAGTGTTGATTRIIGGCDGHHHGHPSSITDLQSHT